MGFSFLEMETERAPKLGSGDIYNNCVLDRSYPIVMHANMSPAEKVDDNPQTAEDVRSKLVEFVAKETGYDTSEIKFILVTADKFFK